MNNLNTFGKRLIYARKFRKLTQREVAKRIWYTTAHRGGFLLFIRKQDKFKQTNIKSENRFFIVKIDLSIDII